MIALGEEVARYISSFSRVNTTSVDLSPQRVEDNEAVFPLIRVPVDYTAFLFPLPSLLKEGVIMLPVVLHPGFEGEPRVPFTSRGETLPTGPWVRVVFVKNMVRE